MVVQLNHTVFEALDGPQLQWVITVTASYEWNTVSNKDWDYTDDELVDCLLVEKASDELAAAHQPDILARLFSKTAYEWADRTAHELHACRGVGWWRITRENDVATRVKFRTHSQARFVGLTAKYLRVD